MKFLIVASALLVAVALADDPHGIKAIFHKCQSNPETHVEESALKQLHKTHGKSEVPENYNKHLLCLAKGLNIVTEEGQLNAEGVKTHVGHVVQEADKAETIVKECAVNQATAEETARHLWKCLHQNHVFGGHASSEESDESDEHHGHNHAHH